MKFNIARSLLVAAGVAALGCAQHKRGARVTGQFTRYGAQMSQGGQTLPSLPDAVLTGFPSVVRFDNANGFEVEAGVGQMRGRYRFERDSIFLDQASDGKTRLAFEGRLFGDTLHLHWLPDYDVGPDSTEAEWQIFFVRRG
jgi:hypothetical protein